MKTRMQPVGNVRSKLRRLVRDLAHGIATKIDLVISWSGDRVGPTRTGAGQGPLDPHGAQTRGPRFGDHGRQARSWEALRTALPSKRAANGHRRLMAEQGAQP
jgi:hypothetical protein